MQFVYEAITGDGRSVHDLLEAASTREAAEALRNKGLLVMKLEEARGAASPRTGGAQRFRGRGAKTNDLLLFTRQMKMLLESGSAIVPALEAVEQQAARPAFRAVVRGIRDRVEGGGSLSEAFAERPDIFKPVFCSMVAAGEATGTLPETFARLAAMAQQQEQVRKQVVGAMAYPAVLCVLVLGVVSVLLTFVIPRFRTLFENLNTALPATTEIMFDLSDMLLAYWPFLLGGLVAAGAGAYTALRLQQVREWLDVFSLRVPVIGPLIGRIVFARVLRVWAAMLRNHVPLLEAIEHSKAAVTNVAFQRLLKHVEESVVAGGRLGRVLADSPLIEPIMASAIATGEENGRLGEAVEFASNWIDEDNTQLVAAAARLAEPVLLAMMGVVVGAAALALFIPLFDIAAAGG